MNLTYWLISNDSPIKKYVIENSIIIGTIFTYLLIIGIGYILWKNREKFQEHYINFIIKWQMKINQFQEHYINSIIKWQTKINQFKKKKKDKNNSFQTENKIE